MINLDIKISFGIIVFNGEPFVEYNLKSIYPYAYEIIVVEGGHGKTKSVATKDGHSVDGTLAKLYKIKREFDIEDKIKIIKNDGFWPQLDGFGDWRTYQSRVYSKYATGDYLWQIDIDEFYKSEDIEKIINMLKYDPSITAMSFKTLTFWGGINYLVDGWALRRGGDIFHRLFKWGKDYSYLKHEPPTIINADGVDVRTIKWITARQTEKLNIYLYHYSLLYPWQVRQKVKIYFSERKELCGEIINWAENGFYSLKKPFRVHNLYKYPSWIERYKGSHPTQIYEMTNDKIQANEFNEKRENADIEKLLNSFWYSKVSMIIKYMDYIYRYYMWLNIKFHKMFTKLRFINNS
jgi:hypothetical protein